MKNTVIFVLLFVVLFTSCNNRKKDVEEPTIIHEVTIQEIIVEDSMEEPPPPPPPHYTSKFATFGEWLSNLCKIENPDSRVQYYEVFLSEQENPATPDKMQYFIGITGAGQNSDKDTIYNPNSPHFYPKEVYLSPSKSVYNKLNEEQAIQKVTAELKAFIQSPQFKNCFLKKAKSIRFRDQVILQH